MPLSGHIIRPARVKIRASGSHGHQIPGESCECTDKTKKLPWYSSTCSYVEKLRRSRTTLKLVVPICAGGGDIVTGAASMYQWHLTYTWLSIEIVLALVKCHVAYRLFPPRDHQAPAIMLHFPPEFIFSRQRPFSPHGPHRTP